MYSYDVWLWRVPIVVTVDTSAVWNEGLWPTTTHRYLKRPMQLVFTST